MNYNFKNLVFEGGGVKGIAYLGVMESLYERGIAQSITRVGGASVGAINAVLVALNCTNDETREILWSMDFNKFKDRTWGPVRNTQRVFMKFGLYKGDYFLNWIQEIISKKTGNPHITFAEYEMLREKNSFRALYIIGSNVSTGLSEIFSCDTTPDITIAEAVRISMSIPLFFAAVSASNGDIYVDGGLLRNYPIRLFDYKKHLNPDQCTVRADYEVFNKNDRKNLSYMHNQETLGFRLDSRNEIDMFWKNKEPSHKKITNFFNYTSALITLIMNAQDITHLESDDWARTIYVDTLGVKATDFNLSDAKKEALIASGKEGVKRYFDWYDKK